jgi:protein-L-isoaspartate O-methyltransferase
MDPLLPPLPSNAASADEGAPNGRRIRSAFQRFPRSLFRRTDAPSSNELSLDVFPQHLVSTLLEALALTGTERVLEIGASSAYLTALLSHLAGEVYSATVDSGLAAERARDLGALGCANVQMVHADRERAGRRAPPTKQS